MVVLSYLLHHVLYFRSPKDAGIFGKPACITVVRDVSCDICPIDSRMAPLSLLMYPSIIVLDSQLFEDSE
ncbi:hypothetical protein NC652_027618 [Populus alba x Populus x berolinensis]|nr:hypothetical protein NC652_027618 [Populus alba x Populus x berolinensis]